MSITLDIPPEIEQSLAESWGTADNGLPRRILEAIAAEGYRQGALTRHEVGQLLGFGFYETQTFLKEHECYLNYTIEDLDADRRALERVLGPAGAAPNKTGAKSPA